VKNANKQANRVALVTGGARRIGKAIVEFLHADGFNVVIHCNKSIDDALTLAQNLNNIRINSAYVLCADLCKKDELVKLIAQSCAWYSRLDVLVNNASIFTRDDSKWDELFMTNVHAPYILSCAARIYLAQTQGCIINITDIHASKPLKDYAVYCQTKAALAMQTKALAREFAPDIRVNAVAPGAIAWPEDENQLNTQIQQKIIAKTLLKRHGEPKYIAQAVLGLINNAFITGQCLQVDGGR
jgi:pteridine reductase